LEYVRSELNPDLQLKADNQLTWQVDYAFESLIEAGRSLSQHNFLTNAGGAAAVLALFAERELASVAIWPLTLFLVGVIVAGLEARFRVWFFLSLHSNAINRRAAFAADRLPLDKATPPTDLGSKYSRAAGACGALAHFAFPSGAVAGIIAFARAAAV
jgi:hypothetical protein